jgi:predicted GIY-YIG superfamily endonuclease
MAKLRTNSIALSSESEWYIYILRCSDGSLYAGITKNIVRRFEQHNKGAASKYTRSRRPVKLVYLEPQRSQSLALKRELAIKAMTRKQKLEMIRKETARAYLSLASTSSGKQNTHQ